MLGVSHAVELLVYICCLQTVLSTQRQQQYPQCPSWFFILEIGILWSQWGREKPNVAEESSYEGKSSANVPGTRAQQKRHPRNNYEKKSISYAINVLGYPGPNIRRWLGPSHSCIHHILTSMYSDFCRLYYTGSYICCTSTYPVRIRQVRTDLPGTVNDWLSAQISNGDPSQRNKRQQKK